MKLRAEIGEEEYDIVLHREGNVANAVINGQRLDAEVSRPEPNVFLIKHGGRVIEALVVPSSNNDTTNSVWINGREHRLRIFDPKRLRGSKTGTDHSHGAAEIRSAMPGKVVRVLSAAGSAVEKGDGVLVVEAMKMQNELKAPKSGVVKAINVSAGDTVSGGDILAVIE